MESKRIVLKISERIGEMVDDIKENYGYNSRSEVIRSAIVSLYNKFNPGYSSARVPKSGPMTAEDIVNRTEKQKKLKSDMAKSKKVLICKRLAGQVIALPSGVEVCRYYTYTGRDRYEQDVPLEMLTADLLNGQFYPSAKAISKLQKAGDVNYKVENLKEEE